MAGSRDPLSAIPSSRRDWPWRVRCVFGDRAGFGRPADRGKGCAAGGRRGRDSRQVAASQHRAHLLVPGDPTTGLAAFCMPYLGRATLDDVVDRTFAGGRPPIRARTILDAITTDSDALDAQESPVPAAVLRRGSYVNGVIHLASQLANALAHSHGRGIYHRDLKPSNVLMAPEGRPLLLDFNLSVDTRLPTWKVGGTLPYMAPEELAKLIRKDAGPSVNTYDPRSDLFSLGAIVYELLTGKLPFETGVWESPLETIVSDLPPTTR